MISNRLKKLTPYVPGEQPQDKKYIKLNTNENPYPPHQDLSNILQNINVDRLRLYPDPNSTKLIETIAQTYNLNSENVFVSNGSDEALSLIFYSFFDKKVVFPKLTYSFYPVYCDFYGIDYDEISLNSDYSINFNSLNGKKDFDGIIFPNPNAPTAIYENLDIMESLLQSNQDKVIVVDEAYIDFGGKSAIQLLNKYENLLIVRTFSKFASLAGIRLGYVLGNKQLIEYLNYAKNSFNSYPIDYIAQTVGIEAMKNIEYYYDNCNKIKNTREKLITYLKNNKWFVTDSLANFVFCKKNGKSGEFIYKFLKDRGVLVRYFSSIPDFVRITIGTDEEIDKLMQLLDEI